MPQLLKNSISELEINLAIQKAVFNKFPDAKINYAGELSSKTVNKEYNRYSFFKSAYGISLKLRYELEVNINGQIHIADIHSDSNREYSILYVTSSESNKYFKLDTIKFPNYIKTFKRCKVRSDIFNECRVEILEFIKKYPHYKIDNSNIEPRLKKLLIFT